MKTLSPPNEPERQQLLAEERLRLVVEGSPNALVVVDREGCITLANAQAENLFGHPRAELIGHRVEMLVPERFRAAHPRYRDGFFADPRPRAMGAGRDLFGLRKDGREVPIEIGLNPLATSEGTFVLASIIDITERKRLETELHERVQLAQFQAAIGAALTGLEQLRTMLQQCAQLMVETLGAAFARIWTLNEKEQVLELQASAGLYTHLDGPHGRVPVGKFKIGLIAQERTPHLTNQVVGDPRVSDQEWARREGMVAFAGYPLLIEDRVVGVVAMFARHPLAERHMQAIASVANKLALGIERKRIEELLRARNEELKGFAYTVSHDLKAPLRGIAGYADELDRRHRAGLSDRAQFCIDQIRTATRNLDRLIEDLLQYSRLDAETPSLTEVNLRGLVEAILQDRNLIISEQRVEVTVDIPFATLRAWERGLVQVLTNLIDNAIKYSRKAGSPRLHIKAEALDNSWRLTVSDNGIGFDMKYHDRIFGLFNRLVRVDEFEGTGAGLAIVKKVLDKQGGRVWAESTPGQGSTFFVELPWHHQPEPSP